MPQPHSYENYDAKSKTYTGMRVALGFPEELAWFEKHAVYTVLHNTCYRDTL